MIEQMIEVKLNNEDDFLKIRETLTRIGVSSQKSKTIYQSCHILHKQQKYYITHFKELFALDGKPNNFGAEDMARRNTIANLLAEWGLVTLVRPEMSAEPIAPLSQIKILPYKEKREWNLEPKYNLGKGF